MNQVARTSARMRAFLVVTLEFWFGKEGGTYEWITRIDDESNQVVDGGFVVGLCSGCNCCDGPPEDFDGGELEVGLYFVTSSSSESGNEFFVAHTFVGLPDKSEETSEDGHPVPEASEEGEEGGNTPRFSPKLCRNGGSSDPQEGVKEDDLPHYVRPRRRKFRRLR